MNVLEAIKARRSVRAYQDRAVEEDKLKAVLEAGRLAPSAKNLQEWRFVVVTDADIRKKLVPAARNQSFVAQAPVVIAGCAEDTDNLMPCGQLSYPIDVTIAVDHMTLAAVELGLGTCWIGAFDEAKVREILGIPGHVRIVTLLTLGYPADGGGHGKSRLSLDEIVKYEKWA